MPPAYPLTVHAFLFGSTQKHIFRILTLQIRMLAMNPLFPTCVPRTVKLRPYQEECIAASLDFFKKSSRHRRLAVSLPVGSGK